MKKALVTGISRGIGLSIAKKLISEGFMVTGTHYNHQIPAFHGSTTHLETIRVNFEEAESVKSCLKSVLADRSFDLLVNNAGIVEDASFTANDSHWIEVWDKIMQVNLKSSALISKWFIESTLSAKKNGILVNISSRAAFRGDTEEYAAYAASKAGMAALTKSIARNYSKKGILAYTIAPGFIDTDMAKASAELLGSAVLTKDSVFDEITSPEEVANIVGFLSRGEVSHMSGSTFHINGGSYML